ncbi:PAP2 superfamily protein [Legionella gratiana]|uniref:PAP2 superfamily n=1 Tax=Legionella gratiana TaxID=45066 RepID=A0A378JEI7_9GAMM|nr:phosphatase PAP2 family protein [Legionella gratiana]KTD12092.1 PAP2 superfamily protein [Legionella gratiana]STX46304.1 PAP2 superfamily [Legionella gratiana]
MLVLALLVIIYGVISTFILIISNPKQKKLRFFYIIINCIIILWEAVPFFKSIHSNTLQILYDWSPLLFLPILHRETEILTSAFNKANYDEQFIHFEKKHFTWVLNFHHNNRANSLILSEFLHLCYLSFFLLLYGVPLFFYLKHDLVAFYESQFVILLLLFSCYITHSIIPVYGPRNIFEKIKDHRSQGFFFRLTHKLLQSGSTAGTAFPSGHTGLSSAVLLTTGHLHTSLFYWILPLGIGLIISTIYGRFHYVIDMLFGFLYALIAFFIATSLISFY